MKKFIKEKIYLKYFANNKIKKKQSHLGTLGGTIERKGIVGETLGSKGTLGETLTSKEALGTGNRVNKRNREAASL